MSNPPHKKSLSTVITNIIVAQKPNPKFHCSIHQVKRLPFVTSVHNRNNLKCKILVVSLPLKDHLGLMENYLITMCT
jgi:hypothetical protein